MGLSGRCANTYDQRSQGAPHLITQMTRLNVTGYQAAYYAWEVFAIFTFTLSHPLVIPVIVAMR